MDNKAMNNWMIMLSMKTLPQMKKLKMMSWRQAEKETLKELLEENIADSLKKQQYFNM